ncbi:MULTISPECIES: ABC transporter permease [Enterococcus]|jgi:ABC-2 type transport system permease protein|uniref:ABC transporter permease n=1 Tax=Enterococcus dispar ATCC 51266 TaxID=1139219 RepID=S1N8R3_9ENTE|nr:ABC transporter permease subunit [Enterococcus dispar]EOT43102.1 hypothetical protein OMK_00438 [Enterococcus dispar ATCC 51266]EOW85450.1 hypothetical protein I569_00762 [Enterococcus dispar ATCC 51266]MCU7358230.1 ABC transporter permease [Enterococcus dispar]MDT2705802.1 ABC transporter permease subunit [Enterococcus dispar]
MKQVKLFFTKELFANWRTKKIPILLIIAVAVGILSPFLAKIMPDIMASLLPAELSVSLPVPTSMDSWTQYYKNLPQFVLLAIALLAVGTISNEVEQGTVLPFITKGLSRNAFVTSKALYLFFIWSVTLLSSFLINIGYTSYYFNDDKSTHLLLPLFAFWLYGIIFLAATIFSSSLAKSTGQSLLILAIFYLISTLSGILKKIDYYNPFILGSNSLNWLTGKTEFHHYWPAVWIAVFLITLLLTMSLLIFRKRPL